MSEEVNAIINNLCDKLGTSAKLLLPELARLRTAEIATMLIIFILLLIFGAIGIRKSLKLDGEDQDAAMAFGTIGVVTTLFGSVGAAVETYNLVGWLVSPRAKAILEIIRMVK